MKPYIDIRFNIFNDWEINKMIQGFHLVGHKHEKYRDTTTLNLLGENIVQLTKKFEPYIHNNVVDYTHLVQWHEGSEQKLHIDDVDPGTTISSITYLNDNFEGGETFFGEGTIVKPVKGKTIFFSGVELIHGVKKVRNGERYTLATWYKKK